MKFKLLATVGLAVFVALGWAAPALAQACPDPNPNLVAPPFVTDCPLPAVALNRLAPYSVTNQPNLSIAPTGNTFSTLSSFSVQSTAAVDNGREFLTHIGFTSNRGDSDTLGAWSGKVALYAGIVCQAGSTDCWAINPLATAETGFFTPPSGKKHTIQVIENDLNNHDQDLLQTRKDGTNYFSADATPIGVDPPYSVNYNASGEPTFRNTAAFNTGGGKWQFGVALFSDISHAAFYEYTSPPSWYGIDLQGHHTAAGIRVGQSLISLDLRHAANERLLVRGSVVAGVIGSNIASVNDNNSALRELEIQGNPLDLNGTVNFTGVTTGFQPSSGIAPPVGSITMAYTAANEMDFWNLTTTATRSFAWYQALTVSTNNLLAFLDSTHFGLPAGSVFQVGATPGVACTGAPTAGFRSVGGIVTSC